MSARLSVAPVLLFERLDVTSRHKKLVNPRDHAFIFCGCPAFLSCPPPTLHHKTTKCDKDKDKEPDLPRRGPGENNKENFMPNHKGQQTHDETKLHPEGPGENNRKNSTENFMMKHEGQYTHDSGERELPPRGTCCLCTEARRMSAAAAAVIPKSVFSQIFYFARGVTFTNRH